MIGSTLILMVGLVDLVGGVRLGRSILGRLLVLAVISVLGIVGIGIHPIAVAVCGGLALSWTWAMSSSKTPKQSVTPPDSATPRLWPVILLFLLVFGITAYDRTGETAAGFLVDAHSFVALKSASSISLETIMATGAVAIFLIRSANLIALAALGRAQQEDESTSHQENDNKGKAAPMKAEERNKWELFVRSKRVASLRAGGEPERGPALKGGRLIGPIERLLIVVLAFSGAPEIIAALAAAKGIVRFPEIAEDRGSGSKAEEFLVGSLTSWTLSAIAVLYMTVVHNG